MVLSRKRHGHQTPPTRSNRPSPIRPLPAAADRPSHGARETGGTFAAKADAEKALAAAVTAQYRGTWASSRSTLTLADYSTQWLESRLTSNGARLRPRVRELYEGQLRLHILPTLGRAPLSKLRTTTVRSWYATLADSGPGASTAAKCYRLLRAILNTAVEDGLLAVNPAPSGGAGAERAAERAIPTIPQVLALADAVDLATGPSFSWLRSAGCAAASCSGSSAATSS